MNKLTSDDRLDFADELDADLEQDLLAGKGGADNAAPRYAWLPTIFLSALGFVLIGAVIWHLLAVAT